MGTKQLPEFLFQFTVDEFRTLFKEVFRDEIMQAVKEALDEKLDNNYKRKSDSIGLDEVIELTGFKVQTVYSKVSRGEIPTLSRGRPLMFSRKVIEKWLKDGKPSVVDIMHEDWKVKNNKK